MSCDVVTTIHQMRFEFDDEQSTVEQLYPKTALPDLPGVAEEQLDENRLYRGRDQLLPHKEALEVHLKNRLGGLYQLE